MRKNKYGGINDLTGWARNSGNYSRLKKNIYDTWFRMLSRVHDPNFHIVEPTYVGCTIDPSWYQFSNFVEDFKKLPGYSDFERAQGKGYALDKDLLYPGNKHYGPSTCCIVTVSRNCSESASRTKARAVLMYTLDGKFVREYRTPTDAEKDGFQHSNISACCYGKVPQHKGYLWRWKSN